MGLFGRVVVSMIPILPRFVVAWVSRRYIAGPTLADAVETTRQLMRDGSCVTIAVLGEHVTDLAEVQAFVDAYEAVIEVIVEHELDANLSLKPTAFGIAIDEQAGLAKVEEMLRLAARHDIFVRLDMEDHPYTDATIDTCLEMHSRGLTNVGLVFQSRLLRTEDDLTRVGETLGPAADYRLCKGIYLEPAEIAHTAYQPIVDELCARIDQALDAGAYVAIASHDEPVILHGLEAIKARGLGPSHEDPSADAGAPQHGKGPGYEFQMLFGVRGDRRRQLVAQGHPVRVYVPYGERWFEYSMRRLRENPDIAWHVTKALFMPWTNRR